MSDRLIIARSIVFIGLFFTGLMSPALAGDIRSEAKNLLSHAGAAQLFSGAEINMLQRMINQQSSDEAIANLLAGKAVLEVTINPEARVSIKRTPTTLVMPQCGKSGLWLIRIVNQGFVTAKLNFRTVTASSAELISLEPVTPRLTGAPVEYRLLRFAMNKINQMDITLGVDAGPTTSDIGERARLPLLLQCR